MNPVSIAQIQDAACRKFGIAKVAMLGPSRMRRFARPRQIAMLLAREMTELPFSEIGAAFGRDSSTVVQTNNNKQAIERDKNYAAGIEELRAELRGGLSGPGRIPERMMRRLWKSSIPYCFTPEGATALRKMDKHL